MKKSFHQADFLPPRGIWQKGITEGVRPVEACSPVGQWTKPTSALVTPSRRLLGKSLPGIEWRYLWRALDTTGQPVDFRLIARRDAKAAKAFLHKAIERVRPHGPVSICTDKAPAYRKVIREINHQYDPHLNYTTHIDKKYRNNRVESDHAALKRLLGYRQSFRSLRSAKAMLQGMEAIRTIKNGHIQTP